MASDKNFIDYVCEQLKEAGDITNKKMFGDYMIYCNGKPILLVCDNVVFAKQLPEIAELFAKHVQTPETGFHYDGAKEHYIVGIDNKALTLELAALLFKILHICRNQEKETSIRNCKFSKKIYIYKTS
jgi:TfoX/Sxy family transcriptional regulator of competence genes